MKPQSQRLAVVIVRSAFDWLVKLRYLRGNPWMTAKDQVIRKRKHLMKIDRALQHDTWETMSRSYSDLGQSRRTGRIRSRWGGIAADERFRSAPGRGRPRPGRPLPAQSGCGWRAEAHCRWQQEGRARRSGQYPHRSSAARPPIRRGYLIAPIVTPTAKARAKTQARERRAIELGTEEALAELDQGTITTPAHSTMPSRTTCQWKWSRTSSGNVNILTTRVYTKTREQRRARRVRSPECEGHPFECLRLISSLPSSQMSLRALNGWSAIVRDYTPPGLGGGRPSFAHAACHARQSE